MSKKKNRLKLPKRLLGVKIPKATRRSFNALLEQIPSSTAKPLLGAAVGTLVTALAERLEEPLRHLIEGHTPGAVPVRRKSETAPPTAH